MIIDGYEIHRTDSAIVIKEVAGESTKSWRAMLEHSAMYPSGLEPEWNRFVYKHKAMQEREMFSVLREFKRLTVRLPAFING